MRIGIQRRVLPHCAKLQYLEFPAVQPNSLLSEKQGTWRCDSNKQPDEQECRREENQHRQRECDVENSLADRIREVLSWIEADIDQRNAVEIVHLCIGLNHREQVRHNPGVNAVMLTFGNQLPCEIVRLSRQADDDIVDMRQLKA